MFKKADNVVRSSLLYIRNATIIISVFITIFALFSYFMNKDKIKMTESGLERSRQRMYEFVNKPEFQKDDITKTQLAMYKGILCYTLGETCTDNPDEATPFIKNSLITKASQLFVAPYSSPPASGILWTFEGVQNAGFIPNTYAQGIGFYALQPLTPIWKVFRNVAYMILVLIVVTIGFLIMFRASISAQAVITIENAIPRIVLAMILITFSFPIAGFLIDVMYLIMGLGGSVIIQNITSSTGLPNDTIVQSLGWEEDIFNSTGWSLLGKVVGNGNIWSTGSAILSLVPIQLQVILRTVVSIVIMGFISAHPVVNKFMTGRFGTPVPIIGDIAEIAIGAAVTGLIFGVIAGIIFPLILSAFVFISTLFLFFRIFFLLFITYTKILLSVIFSPIILIFEAFPEKGTFAYWIKGLFFNLLTFPIVAVLILTAGMIANVSTTWQLGNPTSEYGELWRPPFLYSIQSEGFVMLVAISIIFLIPDMVAFVKKSFGVEDLPFNITPGKLLGGSGIALAGGMGLFSRARSIANELGVTQESIARDNSCCVCGGLPILPAK